MVKHSPEEGNKEVRFLYSAPGRDVGANPTMATYGLVVRTLPIGSLAQLADAGVSKTLQCGFDSHDYHSRKATS